MDELSQYRGCQWEAGRQLFLVFTIRAHLVRMISARPISRRERRVYAHAKSETTEADTEL